MAEITLSSGSLCRPFKSPWGAFPTKAMTISTGVSSNAILAGRVVTLDWTGSTTAGRVVASTADNFFYGVGISAQTVSGSTAAAAGGPILIYEANPLVEFRAFTKGAPQSDDITAMVVRYRGAGQ